MNAYKGEDFFVRSHYMSCICAKSRPPKPHHSKNNFGVAVGKSFDSRRVYGVLKSLNVKCDSSYGVVVKSVTPWAYLAVHLKHVLSLCFYDWFKIIVARKHLLVLHLPVVAYYVRIMTVKCRPHMLHYLETASITRCIPLDLCAGNQNSHMSFSVARYPDLMVSHAHRICLRVGGYARWWLSASHFASCLLSARNTAYWRSSELEYCSLARRYVYAVTCI